MVFDKKILCSIILSSLILLYSCHKYSEVETPAGQVPPVQSMAAPASSSSTQVSVQETAKVASRKALQGEKESERAKIVESFKKAYKEQGSPRIAILLNKPLSDETRQWRTDRRTVISGEGETVIAGDNVAAENKGQPGSEKESVNIQINTTTSSNSEMSGSDDKKRTMTIETQRYIEESKRTNPEEQWIWAFEDGVLDTFLDAKATVVDRAAILRLTSAESDSQAEFKKIEMDALRNHADIIVELLVSQSVDQPPIAEADNSKNADTSANESKNKSKYDSLIKCVVVVETSKAQGSGFFVTSEGHVVTNKHVVSDSDSVTVKTTDGVVWTGRVLQRASKHDLALIKIEGNSQNYLAIANSEEYKAGTETVAIGTPLGLEWSVSKGIVSGVRSLDGVEYLQTDTPINSGNSGGPLISLESGKVLGVNTFTVKKDIAEGLNFAIASNEIRNAFPELQISQQSNQGGSYNDTSVPEQKKVVFNPNRYEFKATAKDIRSGRILANTTTSSWNNIKRFSRSAYLIDNDFHLTANTQMQEVKYMGADFSYEIMLELLNAWGK